MAWAIDFALVFGCAVLLGSATHYRIADYLSGWVELGGTGAWDVLRSNGDWGGAGKTFGMDVVNSVLALVIQAFAALVLVTFLYQLIGLRWRGATFGKTVSDLRVEPRTSVPGRASRRLNQRDDHPGIAGRHQHITAADHLQTRFTVVLRNSTILTIELPEL